MITSIANKRIKGIVQLGKKAGQRRKEDVFLVEGIKMFLEAPVSYIRETYVSESFLQSAGNNKSMADVVDKLNKCRYEVTTDEVFKKMSDTQTPQGILCVIKQFHYSFKDLLQHDGKPLFLVLEDLQDPGNLGTIIRAGEGAGITGVIMSRDTVDIYNPKTIRATMGSIYRVPFFYTNDILQTIQELKDNRIHVYAAHLEGIGDYDDYDYTKATAFLIGNESNGLKDAAVKASDTLIRIPMKGEVESLNAAIAASLLMYEAARQQRG